MIFKPASVVNTAQPYIICQDCDLIHDYEPIGPGMQAKCKRCEAVLYRNKPNSLERTFALTLAAFVFFIIANSFPFLAIKLEGQVVQTTLISGVYGLYQQDMLLLALLVFFTSILVPMIQVLGLLYILTPLRFGFVLPYAAQVFRYLRKLEPWSMMEVFMLGILVTVIKLNTMAEIVPGIAVWSFSALIAMLAWAVSSLEPRLVWDRLGYKHA